MIIKYLCKVEATEGNIIVYHDDTANFYYLPVPTLLKKGLLTNHFSTMRDLEVALGSELTVEKEM